MRRIQMRLKKQLIVFIIFYILQSQLHIFFTKFTQYLHMCFSRNEMMQTFLWILCARSWHALNQPSKICVIIGNWKNEKLNKQIVSVIGHFVAEDIRIQQR